MYPSQIYCIRRQKLFKKTTIHVRMAKDLRVEHELTLKQLENCVTILLAAIHPVALAPRRFSNSLPPAS